MRIFLLIFALSLCAQLKSQTSYGVYEVPYQPIEDSLMTIITDIPDDYYYTEPIETGFPFTFFGNTYESLYIAGNGYVTFNNTPTSVYNIAGIIAPSGSLPANAIFCPLMDVNLDLGGQIQYKTIGDPPNRIFILNYFEAPFFGSAQLKLSSQLKLFEGSNNIEIHITNKPIDAELNLSGWTNYAIEGIQNEYKSVAYVVPGRNGNGIWESTNDAWRFDPDTTIYYNSYISGKVFLDANGNCEVDSIDYPVSGQTVIRNNGWHYTQTDSTGEYRFFLGQGLQQINMNGANPNLPNAYITCPENGVYSQILIEGAMNLENFNFYLQPDSICTDLSVTIHSLNSLSTCESSINHHILTIKNTGWLPADAFNVALTLPDSMRILYTEPIYTSTSNNTFNWQFNDSLILGQTRTIHVYDSLLCLPDNQTNICLSASVLTESDCNMHNNEETLCEQINDSLGFLQMQIKSPEPLNQYVEELELAENQAWYTYKVTFRNTGTTTAQKVIVRDVLPPFFDLSSIELLSSSHNCILAYNSGSSQVLFIHYDINLPPFDQNESESTGSIIFRIKSLTNLSPGQEVLNNATVAFDSESPVSTNWTRIFMPSISGLSPKHERLHTLLYPNPTEGIFHLTESVPGQLEVYDLRGRECFRKTIVDPTQEIDLGELNSGLYFVIYRKANYQINKSRLLIRSK